MELSEEIEGSSNLNERMRFLRTLLEETSRDDEPEHITKHRPKPVMLIADTLLFPEKEEKVC